MFELSLYKAMFPGKSDSEVLKRVISLSESLGKNQTHHKRDHLIFINVLLGDVSRFEIAKENDLSLSRIHQIYRKIRRKIYLTQRRVNK